jgi:hypothetical protein
MADVPGLYLSAAVVMHSRVTRVVSLGSRNAPSISNEARASSIASWRMIRIAGFCEDKFSFPLLEITSSVSRGHVLGVLAMLAGLPLCWYFLRILPGVPPVCKLVGVDPEVAQDGLYKIVVRH